MALQEFKVTSFRTAARALALVCLLWLAPATPAGATEFRMVLGDTIRETDPTPSPDGKWLAYTVGRGNPWTQICVMPIEGGPGRQLTNEPDSARAMTPTWAPDSKSLLYISTRDRSYNVWTVPLEGGEPKRLSNGSGRFAVYSPDGSKIAFPSNRLEPGSLYGYNIYVMDPGGETGDRPARQLTHMNGSPGHPTWSPDGKWVAFVSKDVDTTKSVNVGPGMTAKKSELFSLYRLFKIPAAGGRAIQLSGRSAAEEKVEDVWPTWSPDGKWIAVARTDRDKGKNDVWLVDPERGRPAVQITTMGNCSKPTWSADGKAIWFSTFDKGQEDIWVATDLTIPPPPPPAPKKKTPSFKTVPAKGKP